MLRILASGKASLIARRTLRGKNERQHEITWENRFRERREPQISFMQQMLLARSIGTSWRCAIPKRERRLAD
jgi:hypothetical protein